MALEPVAAPAIELSGADPFARVMRQRHEEMYIVQREESKPEDLIARHEVPEIRMNAGDSMARWGVAKTPARAAPAVVSISNWNSADGLEN